MGGQRDVGPSPLNIGHWEDLVKQTAARIRTPERLELEAELRLHLLRIIRSRKRRVRNWKAFLATALRNKAINWARDWQHRERRTTSLDRPVPAGGHEVPIGGSELAALESSVH